MSETTESGSKDTTEYLKGQFTPKSKILITYILHIHENTYFISIRRKVVPT